MPQPLHWHLFLASCVFAAGTLFSQNIESITGSVRSALQLRYQLLADPAAAHARFCQNSLAATQPQQEGPAFFACETNLFWQQAALWQPACAEDSYERRAARFFRITTVCSGHLLLFAVKFKAFEIAFKR